MPVQIARQKAIPLCFVTNIPGFLCGNAQPADEPIPNTNRVNTNTVQTLTQTHAQRQTQHTSPNLDTDRQRRTDTNAGSNSNLERCWCKARKIRNLDLLMQGTQANTSKPFPRRSWVTFKSESKTQVKFMSTPVKLKLNSNLILNSKSNPSWFQCQIQLTSPFPTPTEKTQTLLFWTKSLAHTSVKCLERFSFKSIKYVLAL